MDIVEEDGKGISQQRRVRIWDKKKRNYVQVNANEVDRIRGGKRIKTESGAKAKKDEKAVGELYKKWQQRTHKSITATGSQEDPAAGGGNRGGSRFKYRHKKGSEEDRAGGRGGRGGWEGDGGNELKSRDQIMKERKEAKKRVDADEAVDEEAAAMRRRARRRARRARRRAGGGRGEVAEAGEEGGVADETRFSFCNAWNRVRRLGRSIARARAASSLRGYRSHRGCARA